MHAYYLFSHKSHREVIIWLGGGDIRPHGNILKLVFYGNAGLEVELLFYTQ